MDDLLLLESNDLVLCAGCGFGVETALLFCPDCGLQQRPGRPTFWQWLLRRTPPLNRNPSCLQHQQKRIEEKLASLQLESASLRNQQRQTELRLQEAKRSGRDARALSCALESLTLTISQRRSVQARYRAALYALLLWREENRLRLLWQEIQSIRETAPYQPSTLETYSLRGVQQIIERYIPWAQQTKADPELVQFEKGVQAVNRVQGFVTELVSFCFTLFSQYIEGFHFVTSGDSVCYRQAQQLLTMIESLQELLPTQQAIQALKERISQCRAELPVQRLSPYVEEVLQSVEELLLGIEQADTTECQRRRGELEHQRQRAIQLWGDLDDLPAVSRRRPVTKQLKEALEELTSRLPGWIDSVVAYQSVAAVRGTSPLQEDRLLIELNAQQEGLQRMLEGFTPSISTLESATQDIENLLGSSETKSENRFDLVEMDRVLQDIEEEQYRISGEVQVLEEF